MGDLADLENEDEGNENAELEGRIFNEVIRSLTELRERWGVPWASGLISAETRALIMEQSGLNVLMSGGDDDEGEVDGLDGFGLDDEDGVVFDDLQLEKEENEDEEDKDQD